MLPETPAGGIPKCRRLRVEVELARVREEKAFLQALVRMGEEKLAELNEEKEKVEAEKEKLEAENEAADREIERLREEAKKAQKKKK